MTAQTLTVTEFVLARIAEDEALARGAGGGSWEQGGRPHERSVVRPADGFDWVGIAGDLPIFSAQVSNTSRALFEGRAAHIARHDPDRVLAQCAAMRKIVELHSVTIEREWENPWDGPARQVEERTCDICGWVPDACDTVRAIASIWSDHPDFREEWRA
jgi:hypothetical protein